MEEEQPRHTTVHQRRQTKQGEDEQHEGSQQFGGHPPPDENGKCAILAAGRGMFTAVRRPTTLPMGTPKPTATLVNGPLTNDLSAPLANALQRSSCTEHTHDTVLTLRTATIIVRNTVQRGHVGIELHRRREL